MSIGQGQQQQREVKMFISKLGPKLSEQEPLGVFAIAPWVIPAIAAVVSAAGSAIQSANTGSSSKSSYSQQPAWNAEQQELFKSIAGMTQEGVAQPAPSSPAMSVPQTGQESSYFNLVNNLASSRAATGQPLYDVGPEWAQGYFENTVKPMYMKEYEEITQPQIKSAYAGNFYSSARQQAESKAAENLATTLASKRAELAYGEVDKRRAALDTAYQQEVQAIETQRAAGEYERSIEQEKVMENLQKYLMGEQVDGNYNPMYNPYMQYAMQLLGLSPYVYTESKKASGSAGSALGGGLMGLGSGMGGIKFG